MKTYRTEGKLYDNYVVRATIKGSGYKVYAVAESLNMSPTALSKKMSGKALWQRWEIEKLKMLLPSLDIKKIEEQTETYIKEREAL